MVNKLLAFLSSALFGAGLAGTVYYHVNPEPNSAQACGMITLIAALMSADRFCDLYDKVVDDERKPVR